MMKILYVTPECAPFCKTGGLADVLGSLPQALAKRGNDVAVILPLYQSIGSEWRDKMEFVKYIYVDLAWRHLYCGLFRMKRQGVTFYFVDNEQYFARQDLYGYYDDGERFGYFSRAVVSLLPHLDFMPEIVHCNDWQSALCCVYISDEAVRSEALRGVKTVFTVHNIEYQGRFGKDTLSDLFGLPEGWFSDGTIAYDGDVDLLKGALMSCGAITTVSPSYAQELRLAGCAHGMDGVMNMCAWKLSGILNGIDMKRYDPKTDKNIEKNYSSRNLAGKAECKAALQTELGLARDADVPVIAVISRLVSHKGLDLICQTLAGIMDLGVQLVVLGKGDWHFEEFFRNAQCQYPGRFSAQIMYDEKMSMRIYSGADMFLMPSRSEPCGLSQMIAMRYGAVPIVRETGGLKDTVHAYEAWCGEGNGFSFANYSASDMYHVIKEAVELYRNDADAFSKLQKRGMTADMSWSKSAEEYENIYSTLLENNVNS